MLNFFLKYTYHLGGNVLSRLLPILFGLLLSRFYSNEVYANFIELLVLSNLIVSFGTGGLTPQLMVLGSDSKNVSTLFRLGFFLLIVGVILGSLLSGHLFIYELCFITFYVLGYGVVGLLVGYLSGQKQYDLIGKIWLFVFLIEIFSAVLLIYFNIDFKFALIIYSFIYFLMGSLFFLMFKRNKTLIIQRNKIIKEGKTIIQNSLLITAFATTTLLGFKLILRSLTDIDSQTIFSVGYQFFAMLVFIPLTLGGIVVPYLSGNNQNSMFDSIKILGVYISISVVQIFIVYLILPYVLNVYKIPVTDYNLQVLVMFLIASLITACNTFFVHFFNSQKRYGTLFFAGVFFLLPILFLIWSDGFTINALDAVYSICFAYGLSLVFLTLKRIRFSSL